MNVTPAYYLCSTGLATVESNFTTYTGCQLNPIRSGLFQTVNDPGGGALKAPPPLRSRKLFCQSSPYHTCEFNQVF